MKLRRQLFSDKEKSNKKKLAGGVALSGTGIYMLGNEKTRSKLTGLENLYHSTDSKFIDNIKQEGILSKYATDKDNITNRVLKDVDMSKKQGKVYLGRRRYVADSVGTQRDRINAARGIKNNKFSGKSKTLKVNIPYEDLKKMKLTENPELLGAKNGKEAALKVYKKFRKSGLIPEIKNKKVRNLVARVIGDNMYDTIGKNTYVVEGNIDSKYIKGSKDYGKYGFSDFKKYVKNNPKRFAEGAVKTAAGVGLVAGGAYLASKGLKKSTNKKKDK